MNELITLATAAVLGILVPLVFVRMLVPALRDGRVVPNYRGRHVFLGLGVVWLVWAGCAIVGGIVSSSLMSKNGGGVLSILTLAGPLALVAFALGLVDDALGGGEAKGFRGHLSAMSKGRLTTGGLKLFGISAASFVVTLFIAGVAPWGSNAPGFEVVNIWRALLAGAAVALTSNFVNLTDLRPGRALKVSSILLTAGVLSTGLLLHLPVASNGSATGLGTVVAVVSLALYVAGPIVAVWPFDLGELGMLGDAGANPMGAVAGLLIVAGLPLWAMVFYLGIMLLLNMASERVSYSSVIRSSSALTWLDDMGRTQESRETTAHEGHNPE